METSMAQTESKPWRSRNEIARRALVLLFALVASSPMAVAQERAVNFVQTAASQAISVLGDRSLESTVRRGKFEAIVLSHFDAPTIGRFVVGPYWSHATPDQHERFEKAFERALAAIYTERFYDYDGESLQVQGTHPGDNGSTVVQTTISTPAASKTYDVDWIVSGPAGREKLLDVVIDGVSTSRTTQQDYFSLLRSSGGNLDALTAALLAKAS
jgi:phospholipid transport system substrate-binding protein